MSENEVWVCNSPISIGRKRFTKGVIIKIIEVFNDGIGNIICFQYQSADLSAYEGTIRKYFYLLKKG